MQLQHSYLIQIFVIPSKAQDVVTAIKKVTKLKYGRYSGVYWQSSNGTEYFDNEKNLTVKLECSVEKNDALLKQVLESIIAAHPWREPVIRISEVQETITEK